MIYNLLFFINFFNYRGFQSISSFIQSISTKWFVLNFQSISTFDNLYFYFPNNFNQFIFIITPLLFLLNARSQLPKNPLQFNEV